MQEIKQVLPAPLAGWLSYKTYGKPLVYSETNEHYAVTSGDFQISVAKEQEAKPFELNHSESFLFALFLFYHISQKDGLQGIGKSIRHFNKQIYKGLKQFHRKDGTQTMIVKVTDEKGEQNIHLINDAVPFEILGNVKEAFQEAKINAYRFFSFGERAINSTMVWLFGKPVYGTKAQWEEAGKDYIRFFLMSKVSQEKGLFVNSVFGQVLEAYNTALKPFGLNVFSLREKDIITVLRGLNLSKWVKQHYFRNVIVNFPFNGGECTHEVSEQKLMFLFDPIDDKKKDLAYHTVSAAFVTLDKILKDACKSTMATSRTLDIKQASEENAIYVKTAAEALLSEHGYPEEPGRLFLSDFSFGCLDSLCAEVLGSIKRNTDKLREEADSLGREYTAKVRKLRPFFSFASEKTEEMLNLEDRIQIVKMGYDVQIVVYELLIDEFRRIENDRKDYAYSLARLEMERQAS